MYWDVTYSVYRLTAELLHRKCIFVKISFQGWSIASSPSSLATKCIILQRTWELLFYIQGGGGGGGGGG